MADTGETVKKTVDAAKASTEKAQATFQANAEQAQAAGAKVFREAADKSAASLAELIALRETLKAALSKTRGEPETSHVIAQLDLLIDEATN